MKATDGAKSQANAMRRARDLRDAQDRAAAEEIATTLVSKVVTLTARAGSEGKLFGSITSSDIANAVETQTGVSLDRRKLELDEPVKTLGTHVVSVKLHSDVEFPVTIEVLAE
jgi:large subunit ribosomal protein L9